MKNTDLRIENLFIEEYSGEIIKVESISEHSIGFSGNFKSTWQAKEIPLTEEWLLKFGFVKKADISGYYFIKDKHRVYLFQNGKFEFEFNYTDGKRVNLFKTFQYVHQLQNLYFALTGEELTIKL